MKRRFGGVLALVGSVTCAISISSIGTVVAQDRNAAGGDAARGEELYFAHGCYGCHGFNGETGARDLVGTNSPIIANLDIFVAYLRLRADFAPLLPSIQMPNYSESALSDADAGIIFAYISTFELSAPDVDDIPALQAVLESAGRPSED